MPLLIPNIGSIFICGFGIVIFLWGLYSFKKKRLIESIPTSKIRSLAMGFVEIYGEVVPMNKTLKSPFTFLPCVYYQYTVEELRSSGKNTHWVTIKKGRDYSLFYLRDETGSVMVDPIGAKIDIPIDNQFSSGTFKEPPAGVRQFLINNNLSHKGRLLGFNKTMRYKEKFIAPGDYLYIMGEAADNPYKAEATASDSVEDVIIKKEKHHKRFYISDKHEQQILQRLNLHFIVGLIGGVMLMMVGLWLMI